MKANCRDCCYPDIVDNKACGCCEGVEPLTPLATANRPGLSQLSYRIGSHSSFLQSMIARLSSSDYPPLEGLTTRDTDDTSIALLDAWATVADVLTFYQERIANEAYLRTASERRSILELARLVGYKLRPGVSSSVFLAYTIDENTKEETTIPAGSRAQSLPGPGELPQSFETSEDLKAQAKWNNLKPRMTQPQTSETIYNNLNDPRVYLKGINTNLKSNDPLLISFESGTRDFYRVKEIATDAVADRTLVTLRAPTLLAGGKAIGAAPSHTSTLKEKPEVLLIKELTRTPSLQPASSLRLKRRLIDQFGKKGETGYRAVSNFAPILRDTLASAAANAKVTSDSNIKVYALRDEASLFGHNAPQRTRILENGEVVIIGDWPVIEENYNSHEDVVRIEHEVENAIYLDARYDQIKHDDWIVIQTQDTRLTQQQTLIVQARDPNVSLTRSNYGMTAPTTRIGLDEKWITLTGMDPTSIPEDDDFNAIRSTVVYTHSEELELAEEPIEKPVCGGTDELLELDGFYEGLESGRWVIVSGEREIAGTSGVRFSELAMLASVTQDVFRSPNNTATPDKKLVRDGEMIHTFVMLAEKLQYCFKRDTVTIYGNVVKATHGETRKEVLGSGDGSKALQSFELKQPPLTHVSASNPTGVDSTLSVFVNDVEWHEMDTLAGLQAVDRKFITRTDDDSKTSILFGNGREGARLPTGIENVRAEYRNGIGKGGNVKAEQISSLITKPLGVKGVINPLRASGGANRENRDQARKSTPLAVKALDRLVSVRDYEDFSRLYAGIGKADAVEISDNRRQLVHVTIAGADDIPIDQTSDLYKNLRQALHDFGDPFQPIQLAVRELMFIVIEARIDILPDYQWESVESSVRETLLEAFSFERRELGQDVVLSEIMSVMQSVQGVAYVDVDAFGGIPEKIAEEDGQRRLLTPDEVAEAVACLTTEWSHDDMDAYCETQTANSECDKFKNCKKYGHVAQGNSVKHRLPVNMASLEKSEIRPAQLAFLTPDVPDTLILNQIER